MKLTPTPLEYRLSERPVHQRGGRFSSFFTSPSVTFGQAEGDNPPPNSSGNRLKKAWQTVWPLSITNQVKGLLKKLPREGAEGASTGGGVQELFVAAALEQENPIAWAHAAAMVAQDLPVETDRMLDSLLPLLRRSIPQEMVELPSLLKSLKASELIPNEGSGLSHFSKLTEQSGQGVKPLQWFTEQMPAFFTSIDSPKTRRYLFYTVSKLYQEHAKKVPGNPPALEAFFSQQLQPVIALWRQVVGSAGANLKATQEQSLLQYWNQMMEKNPDPAVLASRLSQVVGHLEKVQDKPHLLHRQFQFATWVNRFENLPAVLNAHLALVESGQLGLLDDKFLIELEGKSPLPPEKFQKNLTELLTLFDGADLPVQNVWSVVSFLSDTLRPEEEASLIPIARFFMKGELELTEGNLGKLRRAMQRVEAPEAFFDFATEQIQKYQEFPALKPMILSLLIHPHDQQKRVEAIGNIIAKLQDESQEYHGALPEKKVLAEMIAFTGHVQVSLNDFETFWEKALEDLRTHKNGKTLEMASLYQKGFDDPRLFVRTFPMVLNIPPHQRLDTVRFAQKCIREVYRHVKEEGKTPHVVDVEKFIKNVQFLLHLQSPTELLNAYMMNRDSVMYKTLHRLYKDVDYTLSIPIGKQILPELMAMMDPYFASLGHLSQKDRKPYIEQASMALTRLYHYLYSGHRIDTIEPVVLNSWSRVGTVGLSFSKWQYDAMSQWKGQGPMEKPTLFEQSGLFTRIPPRDDDPKYFGGFVHRDPEKGLSIEMRRAYIVISQKDVGSLVIRNSSPVFGRDLLKEPGYFNAHQTFQETNAFFKPETLLENVYHQGSPKGKVRAQADDYNYKKDDFASVLSKHLNQTHNVQKQNQGKVLQLLDAFDEVMEKYITWKSDMKEGKPSEGMKQLMKTALATAQNNGSNSPYGKKKNIRLAWVPPQGMPYIVSAFDVSQQPLQEELAFYLNTQAKSAFSPQAPDFESKIPNLLAFLRQGLAQGYELVLKE